MTTTPDARNPILVRFGSEVRAARERRGSTQQQVATQLGISRRQLGNVENGRGLVSNRLYWRIANHLGLDATDVTRQEAS